MEIARWAKKMGRKEGAMARPSEILDPLLVDTCDLAVMLMR